MEPPLRIRALQLTQSLQAKDWLRVSNHSFDRAIVAFRRRDGPVRLDHVQTDNDRSTLSIPPRRRRKPSKDTTERQRRQFLQEILFPPATDLSVHSPAATWESLFACFVNDLAWIQSAPPRYPVLHRLRTYLDAGQDNGPMAAATEALLLTQFAHTLRDDAYLEYARKRYGLAMSRCAKRLAITPRRLADWIETLASVQALWTCEMYERLSEGAEVWIKHSEGMFAIIRQLPVRAEDLGTNEDLKTLIYNTVDSAVKMAVFTRRPPIFAEKHWLDLLSSSCDGRGRCLLHIVCRVPMILYEMDHLSDKNTRDPVDILQELLTIERDLLRWLHAWYRSCDHELIRTTSVEDFPEFVTQHRNTYSIFPRVFDFPSPVEAQGHLIYYDWLSLVRKTICILQAFPQYADIVSDEELARAIDRTTECADAACMLAPACSRIEQTERSKALAQVVDFAVDWYERTNQDEKLEYALDIRGDDATHEADHQSLRWLDVNGFLVRRVLFQHFIGPPVCILKEQPSDETT